MATHRYVRASSPVNTGTGRAEWANNTDYAIGDRVVPTQAYATYAARKFVYECTAGPGKSHLTTQPTWPTTAGNTVVDNAVTWTCRTPTTWANASLYLWYLCYDFAVRFTAGDYFWIDSTSVQTHTGDITLIGPFSYNGGSLTARTHFISTSDLVNEPPTSRAVGAHIRTTIDLQIDTRGAYFYGIKFEVGYTASSGTPSFYGPSNSNDQFHVEYEECTFKLAYAAAGSTIEPMATSIYAPGAATCINCTFELSHASQKIASAPHNVRIVGGNFTGTMPTCPFNSQLNNVESGSLMLIGVDLSSLTANIYDISQMREGYVLISRCKLNSGVTPFSGRPEVPGIYGTVELCSDEAQNYRLQSVGFGATLDDETLYVRTNGASDGVTPISWRITSIAGLGRPSAFRTPWIAIWQNDTGSSKTFTVEILHDNVTALKDDEIWLEVLVPTDASFPISSFLDDQCTPGFASADQASSSVEWTTSGMSDVNKQKLSVTATPQMKGVVYARVAFAKATYTVYVDPMITVS